MYYGSNHRYGALLAHENHFWEINMEFVILSLMVISLLIIFAVDTAQKRHRFLRENY